MPVEAALLQRADVAVAEAHEPAHRAALGDVLASVQGVSDAVEEGELGVAYVRLDELFAANSGR